MPTREDGVPREVLFRELAKVQGEEDAAAYAARFIASSRGDEPATVLKEAGNIRSCLNLYAALRAVAIGERGERELEDLLRTEERRWHGRYGHRFFKGARYSEEVGQFLLNIIDSKIRDSRVDLVRTIDDPIGFAMMVRGPDWLADVYLHLAGLIVERRPLALCAAPDCGRYFIPLGKMRYDDVRCAARHRQQRRRNANVMPSPRRSADNHGR